MNKRLTKILIYLGVSLIVLTLKPIAIFLKQIFQRERKSLEDKVALVSGAGRGLGRGLALTLAREGCKVAVVDLDKESAEKTTEEIRLRGGTAQAYVTNVANVQEVKALRTAILKDLGDVYLLVNNAGIVHAELLDDMEDDTIRTMIDVNLTSQYWMVREFLPDMKERDSGHIVAISSVTSYLAGPGVSVYSATKAGVKVFMDSLRAEMRLNKNNIQVTTIFPFFIKTRNVDQCDIRLCPALSVDETVAAIVDAIRSNKISISVPRSYSAVIHLILLLPYCVIDKIVDAFTRSVKMRSPPEINKSHMVAE